ncbi:hypothetical protein [Salinarimonas sp.]|uniref:hypothetical protein n=1 Tax=Salinarimonas sp. TaxID=2766526 RepID=UPI00391B9E5B
MDTRRSGAVEVLAGSVGPGALAAKLGKQIDDARALQATYLPVDPALVRAADEARRRGCALLRASVPSAQADEAVSTTLRTDRGEERLNAPARAF